MSVEREHPSYVSACCSADVHVEDNGDPFDPPLEGRTCWWRCDQCDAVCDVKVKEESS